jgi:putative addiction module killer protein
LKYRIIQSIEFASWLKQQGPKDRVIINARIDRLRIDGHWGFVHRFDGLIELKWTSGLRIYTGLINSEFVIVLLGGNKNGQSKDIKKAKKIFSQISQRI